MKITMYELYGKIYNEEPPKQIKVYGEYWYWNDYDGYVTKESLKTTPDAQWYLMDRYRTFMDLDKEVEIIEPQEHKIPEKLKYISHGDGIAEIPSNEMLMNKINEILDYLEANNGIMD